MRRRWPAAVATIASIASIAAAPAAAQPSESIDLRGIGYDRGNPDATITVIEFGDFACSACGLFARETMPAINREYILPGRIHWKYIPFVLGSFPNAEPAARAAECAADQDAFWSMHDQLYSRQKEWSRTWRPAGFFEQLARELELDVPRFRQCYENDADVTSRIARNNGVAQALFVRATPTFFVNGARIRGAIPIEQFRAVIAELARRREEETGVRK